MKLTHDGGVALFEDEVCVFSVEVEKLANQPRYSPVDDLAAVPRILRDFGYRPDDVDHWAVDGWDGRELGHVEVLGEGRPMTLTVAGYREHAGVSDLLSIGCKGDIPIGGKSRPYTSYLHLGGHVASAYCTSPFARRQEPSFVLAWDGGTFPRLYHVDPGGTVASGGPLFPLIGHVYATAAHHFGPYTRPADSLTVDDLSVAGKLMAYIALGEPRDEVQAVIGRTFRRHFEDGPRAAAHAQAIGGFGSNAEPSLRYVHEFFRDARAELAAVSDEDVLASFHDFLEHLLVERITERIRQWRGAGPWNLCFVGGCALNIKWNSALRAHPMFTDVWVPPFPNDSGSAFGTASIHLMKETTLGPVDWNVRLGPALLPVTGLADGWTSTPCGAAELGRRLHATGRPVVLLDGRAELGPRALGGRSIIAPATDPAMKDQLNGVKKREGYRPVAPICLRDAAPDIFDPGTPDPYMLFDHRVRPGWADRIPAVLHLDGTARLQTVDPGSTVLHEILDAYRAVSGIPVLCNTSANRGGRGFFPDVASAMEWGRVPAIWSDGILFTRPEGTDA